jgi:APA family basic amino acid/polyamine antiporter
VSHSRETPAGDIASDGLARRIGLWGATALVVGNVIGSGIFVAPGDVLRALHDPRAGVAAWILGGVLTLAGAFVFAELGATYPETGGQYVFLRRAFGPRLAFVFGWAELWVIKPTGAAGIAVIFASYVQALWPALPARAVAIAALIVVYALNLRSLAWSNGAQTALTAVKVAGLVALGAWGLAAFGAGAGFMPRPTEVAASPPAAVTAWGAALVAILWTFDGWSDVTYVAGEVRSPHRVLPRALVAGTAFTLLVYLGIVWAVQSAFDAATLPAGAPVLSLLAARLGGAAATGAVTALVLVSTFGSMLSGAITTPRIFFAMARDGLFFARLGRAHPRYHTPDAAIFTIAAAAILYVATGTFAEIVTYFVFVMWLFYALTGVALYVLRRREPHAVRPFRSPGYPWTAAAFVVASAAMLASVAWSARRETAIGAALVLSGWPVYALWVRWQARNGR